MNRSAFLEPRASIAGLLETVCVLGLAGTWLGELGRWHWFWDLFAHFRPQYVLVSLLILVMALVKRRRVLGIVASVTFIWNACLIWSVHDTSGGQSGHGRALRVTTFNVLTSNATPESAVRHLLETDADIVCVLEADTGWETLLQPLRQKYAHHLEELPHGNFGIAVFTRLEVRDMRIIWPDPELPSVQVQFQHDGRELNLIATHTLPPMTPTNAARWRKHLSALRELAEKQRGEVIVAGDLNATPWCEGMRLLRAGDTLDFRSTEPVWLPTWGLKLPMMMPIDHVLVTRGLLITKRQIGPETGSDHRSVTVGIQAARSKE